MGPIMTVRVNNDSNTGLAVKLQDLLLDTSSQTLPESRAVSPTGPPATASIRQAMVTMIVKHLTNLTHIHTGCARQPECRSTADLRW